jgi:hypothetical protein
MTTLSVSTGKVAPISKLLWVGPLAGAAAAVANTVVYFIGRAALGELYHQLGPGGPVEVLPFPAVAIASFVPALFATVLYAVLGKFTSRPTLIFVIVAVVFGLVSLGSPLTLGIDLQYRLALSLMHIVAGVTIVGVLTRLGADK